MDLAPPIPLTRDLVIVGGGHAAALVLRRWGMAPLPGVRLTLVNPDPVAPYSGMLPGLIAGHYGRADLMIDLVRLARHAGARLVIGRVEGIDRAARTLAVPGRPDIAYDVALIDVGIGTAPAEIAGFAGHGVPAKPLGPYVAAWEAYLARARSGAAAGQVAVIGAGVAGVELALASAARMASEGIVARGVTILDTAPEPLGAIAAGTRQRLLAQARAAGVRIIAGARIARVHPEGVDLEGGERIGADFVLGVAGARPQGWLAQIGLASTDGFLDVAPTLQSTTDPAIFAAGDCAHFVHAPRPKAGVYAVRAAPVLFHNLRAVLSGNGRLRQFHPQREYLKLITTGPRHAIADRGRFLVSGGWVWRWKDRIDRRFMAQFHELPPVPAPVVPAMAARGVAAEIAGRPPLCGGCGAKVGPGALAAGLVGLGPPVRADVRAGAGDDAALLAHPAGAQLLTVDQLRAFDADPVAMTRIALIHALGDIWAMGGQPQAGLAIVTLPRMSETLQARTLAEISATASGVLRALGAELAGGHTMQGAEFAIGFSLTGLAARPLRKGGALPGDRLILTRPLGAGVIMAALMADRPPPPEPGAPIFGEAVAAALAGMQHPGAAAAAILAAEARAMTDVTGFGLAGHLGEMLAGSGRGARLDLAAIPLLPLAVDLAAMGVRAHLAAPNRAGLALPLEGGDGDPRAELLVDPQTAGGLLAAVPALRAGAVLDALRTAGESQAADIGCVTDGAAALILGGSR
jgi:selenide,water dikinase